MHRTTSLCAASVALVLAVLSCAPGLPEPGASPCPDCNLVLVTFDALAARRIGFFGAQRNTTPELDRFARDAFVFTDAISQAGTTVFSVASLFTSRLPHTDDLFGIGDKGGAYAFLGGLAKEERTLAEMLADRGYATAAVSGWWYASTALGKDHGFEIFESRAIDERERAFETLARAVEVLRGLDPPFFLWVHFRMPHTPHQPEPEVFREFYEAAPGEPTLLTHTFLEVLSHFEKSEPATLMYVDPLIVDPVRPRDFTRPVTPSMLEQLSAMYDGNVRNADRAFGKLMEELESHPQTIVVVAADHGESLGAHGRVGHNSLYQEVLHTPIMLRLPAGAHAVLDYPVSNLDIIPTILDLVGANRSAGIRGRSLFASDRSGDIRIADTASARSVQRHSLKLIEKAGRDGWEVELYDLASDPGEEFDLAARRPELVEELRAVRALMAAPRPLDKDDPMLEALRALGYLEDPAAE